MPLVEELQVGVAGTIGQRQGTTDETGLSPSRTIGRQDFFDYNQDMYADGLQTRIIPQMTWAYKNQAMVAEYAFSNQKIVSDTIKPLLVNHQGWAVTGYYVLTGEDYSFKNTVIPKQDFSVENAGWGAFALSARMSGLSFDKDNFARYSDIETSAQQALHYGVGVDWYLTRRLKFMQNFDVMQFQGGYLTGDRADEKALFSRVQIRF